MKKIAFFCTCLILILPAWAHLNSISYSTISLEEKCVHMELRYSLVCTLELFAVDRNGDLFLSDEELEAGRSTMLYYLNNKIKVLSGGRQLRMAIQAMTFHVEEQESDVVFKLLFSSQEKLGPVIIFCNLSEEVDAYHRNLSQISMNGHEYNFVFTSSNYFDSTQPPQPLPADGVIFHATPN